MSPTRFASPFESLQNKKKQPPKWWLFFLAEKERFLRSPMQLHTALRASSVAVCSAVAVKTCPRHVLPRPSNLFKSQTKNHPIGWFLFGGEGEIRTLERFYPLHDFQSCALDQLSDFSVLLTSRSIALDYYITAIPQCQHKNLIVLRNNFAFWGNYF